jgi:hypothetical protein
MWTIFEVLVLIAAGGIIILGGEIDGRAIGVSVFLGLTAFVVWLASSLIFSKLADLARSKYRRRGVGSLFLFTRVRQYFRGFMETQLNTLSERVKELRLSERVKELREAVAASGRKIDGAFRSWW